MAETRDDEHASIDDTSGDEDTMTDDGARRAPVTRVLSLPKDDSVDEARRDNALVDAALSSTRFRRREVLGRGGMGEVTLWRDDRLGREVAVKTLLPHAVNDGVARARFLREARVQGQLEHPAIVPVYDLQEVPIGSSPGGEEQDRGLSLTMKRVRGKTLATIFDEHRRALSTDGPQPPSRKLLSAFANVCLAVDFAHARGIVHRDLKPGNIMLGDFGEVYVLDWGLAKILGEPDDDDDHVSGALSTAAMTQSGAMLGTLGYMAPEQLDDALGPVSAATDVYALGAILFELLTSTPLLFAASQLELMQRTLQGVDARMRTRAPGHNVPPELEDLCVAATRKDVHTRGLSARAMYDAIEGYLEGDRDLSRRRALAASHVEEADAVLARARDGRVVEEVARATAMRELGSALALDAGNVVAGRALVRLLAEPPREIPAAVRAELDEVEQAQLKAGARAGAPMAVAWSSFLVFGFFMPVLDWRPLIVMGIVMLAGVVVTVWNNSMTRVPPRNQALIFSIYFLMCVSSGFVAGPLITLPTVLATFIASLQTHPVRRIRSAVLVVGLAVFCVVVGLEWAGVLPHAYVFDDAGFRIVPFVVGLPETPTRVLLIAATLGSTIAVALFISKVRDALAEAQERNVLLGWHLRQLVSDEAPPPSP